MQGWPEIVASVTRSGITLSDGPIQRLNVRLLFQQLAARLRPEKTRDSRHFPDLCLPKIRDLLDDSSNKNLNFAADWTEFWFVNVLQKPNE